MIAGLLGTFLGIICICALIGWRHSESEVATKKKFLFVQRCCLTDESVLAYEVFTCEVPLSFLTSVKYSLKSNRKVSQNNLEPFCHLKRTNTNSG